MQISGQEQNKCGIYKGCWSVVEMAEKKNPLSRVTFLISDKKWNVSMEY